MGNSLINSIVRGFGFTLGRKAADALTTTNRNQSVRHNGFSKKQLELIQTNQDIKAGLINIKKEAEVLYAKTDGGITEIEYNILISDVENKIKIADDNIVKIQSVRKSGGGLKYIFYGLLIGLVLLSILSYAIVKLDGGKSSARYEAKVKADSLVTANSNVEYYKGHIVHTGTRGGKYYLTKRGRKHYL